MTIRIATFTAENLFSDAAGRRIAKAHQQHGYAQPKGAWKELSSPEAFPEEYEVPNGYTDPLYRAHRKDEMRAATPSSPGVCARPVGSPVTRPAGRHRELTGTRTHKRALPSERNRAGLSRSYERQTPRSDEASPTNPAHAARDTVRTGPATALESRTCTTVVAAATSTH